MEDENVTSVPAVPAGQGVNMKNISWMTSRSAYRVQFKVNGQMVFCGDYKDLDEAALTRDIVLVHLGRYNGPESERQRLESYFEAYENILDKIDTAKYLIKPKTENPSRKTKVELRLDEAEAEIDRMWAALGSIRGQLSEVLGRLDAVD